MLHFWPIRSSIFKLRDLPNHRMKCHNMTLVPQHDISFGLIYTRVFFDIEFWYKSKFQKRNCSSDNRVYMKMDQDWENGELKWIHCCKMLSGFSMFSDKRLRLAEFGCDYWIVKGQSSNVKYHKNKTKDLLRRHF